MSKNPNHPKKGSKIKVEPIKEMRDIRSIRKLLADKPRDLCIFTLGTNTALRASDLLSLKVKQVRYLRPDDDIEVREKKTRKDRRITFNKVCVDAIRNLLATHPYKDGDYLFRSERAKVLTVPSLNRLVKSWCKAINLRGNYGSHTLRKTFGFIQRTVFGVGLPELMDCLGHASQKTTLTYLCLQAEEIRSIYNNVIA